MTNSVRRYALLLFALSLVWTSCARPPAPSPFVSVRIIHTNDIHGHILPEPDLRAQTTPPPMFGGAASLATAIRHLRRQPVFGRAPDLVLYLDAGDFFQGTPEGNLTRGRSMVELFQLLGLSAQTAGNHDFDFGSPTGGGNLDQLIRQMSWPFIITNARTDQPAAFVDSAVLFDARTGLQIHLFGIITDDMSNLTVPASLQGVVFPNSLETARAHVAAITDSPDLVIAITHVGIDQDTVIANGVPGINLIVGGHTHTSLSPYYIAPATRTAVVQTGGSMREVGVVDILYNRASRKVVRLNSRLIPLYESEFPPNPRVRRWLKRVSGEVGQMLDKQVAVSAADYYKSSDSECVPGNLMTDAMRRYAGADAAFQNSFGIRADLPKGPITLRTLFTMMPFDNTVVAMSLTGSQLMDLLEQSASLQRGFLQMSGPRMLVDLTRPVGERVLSVEIDGKPVDPARTYRVATNSFLADGGDLFTTFARGTDRKDDGANLRDVVRDYLVEITATTGGLFNGTLDGRITVRPISAPVPVP